MGRKNEGVIMDKAKKWQLKRFVIIHNAIKRGNYPSFKKLQRLCEEAELEASKSTIERSLNDLRNCFGVPIEYDRAKNGYYLLDDNYDFSVNSVSTHDVFYLSTAKTMLSTFKGTSVYDSISDVIDFVTDTQYVGRSALLKRIAIPPVPLIVTHDDEVWKHIMDSLRTNRVIEFDYSGRWNTATRHRRVHPYQLLLDQGRCFVFGYDENAAGESKERLFALNRIKNFTVTDATFELPEDYEFSSRCEGGRFGSFIGEGPVDFVVDFYGYAREYVKECVWADNQKIEEFDEEGKTRISLTTSQVLSVKEWVLAQGANAVPVSPDWFVEQWKENVRGMAERAGLI